MVITMDKKYRRSSKNSKERVTVAQMKKRMMSDKKLLILISH